MESQLRGYVAPNTRTGSGAEVSSPQNIKERSVQALLHNVNTIRVGVEYARGRGSMSASMAALRELIRLTKGRVKFQVVYEKGAEQSLRAIVGSEFDPSNTRQRVRFNGTEILFAEAGYLKERDKPSGRTIGFVGAHDMPDHDASRWLDLLGDNRIGQVSAVGVGQPFDWNYGGPQCVLYPLEGRRHEIAYLDGIPKGYPLHIPDYKARDLENVLIAEAQALESRRGSQALINEKKNLARIFAELSGGRIDVLPVYGIHHPKMRGQEDGLLRNICGGIRDAQSKGLRKKPVVVVVIGDYENEIRLFDTRRVAYPNSSSSPDKIFCGDDRQIYYPNKARDNSRARDNISDLRRDEIMLLYAGRVEQRMFEQLFRLSTLPPVIEGANSANLCLNLPNKTYLHMSVRGTHFPESPDAQRGRTEAHNLSMLLEANKPDGESRDRVREDLGNFILRGRDPQSDVSRYFHDAGNKIRSENQVIDVLYPISQKLGFGPSATKPLKTMDQVERSPYTNITYERWSDGKLFYRNSGERDKREFSLKDLEPAQANQKSFSHDHWEQPSDLLIMNISFGQRHILMEMVGPRKETYQCKYDETQHKLSIFQKGANGGVREFNPPLEYRRPSKDRITENARYK